MICSFVTEFQDHIFVAMDAEAILFLHDLVMAYLKEKDRGGETVLQYILNVTYYNNNKKFDHRGLEAPYS